MHCTVHHRRPGALRVACLLLPGLLAAACSGEDPGAPFGSEFDVARYDLRGEFDWERGRLVATLDLTLSITGDGPRTVVLDSAVAEVKGVRQRGGGALPHTFHRAYEALTIDLSGVPEAADGGAIAVEIDYEALAGDALRAVPARKGDPVAVRAVYTISEPLGASRWMPCHNTPSDRALFSIAMRVDDGEAMIANGDLVGEEDLEGSGRLVHYETAYPLPTYLMAFAIGDFEVERGTKGDLPIAVWRRRGLPGDYGKVLGEIERAIGRFEELLVPYPFEKYALVLLPDFSVGGVEHASISFQREERSTQPALASDLLLTTHELAHQWFGDLVTVESWDDLWIKEGMATLLENEGARAYTDESGAGTLNGDELAAADGDAARDVSLDPDEKYTSGPYGRAAWVLTQIRSLVGEDAFWSTLRGVLEEHRFGSLGTDAFLDAFAPALGPEATARARRAVVARALPSLEVDPAPSGGAFVTLRDPEGALVAPLDVAWVAADGATRAVTLAPGERVELAPGAPSDLLVVDPQDRHPEALFLSTVDDLEGYLARVAPLRAPRVPEAIPRFLELGGAHQLAALKDGLPEGVGPERFEAFVEGLDAGAARGVAVAEACEAAGVDDLDPALRDAWASVLAGLFAEAPPSYGLDYVGSYAACGAVVSPEDLFADEWAALEAGLPSGELSGERLLLLSKFRLPAARALRAWGQVARTSGSVRARLLAIEHLTTYLGGVAPAELPAWRAFFARVLDTTDVSEILRADLHAVVASAAPTAEENAEALDGLIRVLRARETRAVHAEAVCAAFELTGNDRGAWGRFTAALEGAALTDHAAALLRAPAACG
ncbi:aminopeptidase [Sorangium cellulosum]|uniref:Aminopeptidase N n=1 Tax=Sorangium cellulosum TaxID=56 RepID=A0A4P2Q664_SORCE|nr:M1 family aminopeptidase [Sorangium cellulosum]AUX24954.1 aminopeptidase [Sorangium cellulosum]